MPEEDHSYADLELGARAMLDETLSKTFDEIAKIAMRASSDFSAEVENRSVRETLTNAHSIITLIIDDAMRGLGKATTSAMLYAGMTIAKSYEEPED